MSLAHFDIGYAIGEEDLSEEELEKLLASAEDGLALFKGQWIEIDREKLNEVLEHWENVRAEAEAGNISYLDGIRMLSGLPGRKDKALDADELEDIDGWSFLEAGEGFKELLQAARGEVPLDAENIPELHATLRPYQVYGVSWMRLLGRLGMGACLADDMGLGKTIQVLALLLSEKEREKGLPPSLLIVPASLLANWKAEAARFAPTLKIAIVHPSEQLFPRKLEDMPLKGLDLVITTYSMCTRLACSRIFFFIKGYEEHLVKSMPLKEMDVSRDMTDEDRGYHAIFERLKHLFEEEKPFLDPEISVSDVARSLFTNKAYLSRTINLYTGRNFCQFVNYYRIRYAVSLFQAQPDMKLADLAERSGFRTVNSFSMAFRLYMNMTPGEWCRKYKHNANNGA